VLKQNGERSGAGIRRKHRFEHRQRHFWFMSKFRNRPVTGIEIRAMASVFGQRIMIAIILAHGVAVVAIGARAAELFDPRMLVRRHALRSELAADPIGFLGKDDSHSIAEGCERAGASAYTGADNCYVGMKVAGRGGG
jgi:hypothetical protein